MDSFLDPVSRELLIGVLVAVLCLQEFAQVNLANGPIMMLKLDKARLLPS